MAYAAIQDLIDRFGEIEMIRATTPDGQDMDGIGAERANAAIDDASAMIDSYVRKRYRTPLEVAPAEIRRTACDLARYYLATGDGRTPSEEVTRRQKDAIAWLRDIATGAVVLDLDEVAAGDESYATVAIRGDAVSERPAPFGRGFL